MGLRKRLRKRQTGPFRAESTPQPFRHGTNPVYVLCNVQVSVLVPESGKNYVIYLTYTPSTRMVTTGNPAEGSPYFRTWVAVRMFSIYL